MYINNHKIRRFLKDVNIRTYVDDGKVRMTAKFIVFPCIGICTMRTYTRM